MKQWGRIIVQQILCWCAKASIAIHRPLVIAISGSTDKTLVKEVLSSAFRSHGHAVRANPRSFNTEIGLPLAILYLPSGGSSPLQWIGVCIRAVINAVADWSFPPVLVVELGVDRPGDMEYLLRIVRPTVAILTTCTEQYLPNFSLLERYADEFRLLVKSVPSCGLVVLNSDDDRIRAMASHSAVPVMTVGEQEQSSIRIATIVQGDSGQSWTLRATVPFTMDQKFSTHRPGSHHRFALSTAFVVHQWYDANKPQSKIVY